MAMKISSLMGLDVYTDSATFVGKVYDIIIDLQKGEVVRLALEPVHAGSREETARLFREKTILYKSVRAAEKIIIVSSTAALDEETPAEEQPAKPMPYRYRYGHQPPK